MLCPRCGTVVADRTQECPSCGMPPSSHGRDPTTTRQQRTVRHQAPEPEAKKRGSLAHFGATWADATIAAALSFLVLLVIGALLLIALKLRFPFLGGGGGIARALAGIGVVALAVLGAPVRFGGSTLWSLPMGALALLGVAMIQAGADLGRRCIEPREGKVIAAGARLGAPFAVVCLIASLVFRVASGHRHIDVSPFVALLLGGFWGTVFGSIGAAARHRDLGARFRRVLQPRADRALLSAPVVGAVGGSLLGALAPATVLAAVLVLGRIAQGFFSGHTGGTGAAGLVLLAIAFAPNIVITLACAGLGAPLQVGAGVRVGKHLVGPSTDLSLLGWVGHPLPGWMLAFLVVPLIGGWLGARRLRRLPASLGTIVGGAATTGLAFGLVMAVAAVLARAHLGLRIVHSAGFASLGPDPLFTLILGSLWVALIAGAGAIVLQRKGA